MFLQETHTLNEDNIKVARRWKGNIYATSFTSQARGVMTLIHESVSFRVCNIIGDKFGRYLIIHGSLLSLDLNLVNVYGPNSDEPRFFTDLFLTFASLTGEYIIAGDWNCTLDPGKDRSTGTDQTHNKSRSTIHHFIKELHLVDIWRYLKPNDIAFSWHLTMFQKYSRIDYFLVSESIMSKIQHCFYDSILILDHRPCCLIYVDKDLVKDPPRWRFNRKWMLDEKCINYLGKEIDNYFRDNNTNNSWY